MSGESADSGTESANVDKVTTDHREQVRRPSYACKSALHWSLAAATKGGNSFHRGGNSCRFALQLPLLLLGSSRAQALLKTLTSARARACEEVLKLQLDLQRAHTRAHWLEADQFFAAAAFFPAFAAQLDLYEVYSQEEESLNTRVRKR